MDAELCHGRGFMMVALVTDEYPPGRGTAGIGTYSRTLARLLASHGHQVHVFCQDDGIRKPSEGEVVHSVRAYEPPFRLLRFAYFRCLAPLLEPLERRARWGITVARRILKTERAAGRQFDVIEIPEAGGYAGLARAGGVRSPVLIRLHGSTAMLSRYSGQRVENRTRRLIELERWSLRFGNLIAAPSRAILRETAPDLGIPAWLPDLVYPNPVPRYPLASYTESNRRDPNIVLTVGRLCYLKGADLVVAAFNHTRRDFRNLHVVMVGKDMWEGPSPPTVMRRALGDAGCTVAGVLDPVGVRRWMCRAGMLVVASRFENYPTVILEALECGCLVVASNIGGIPEIVTDRETGLLFQSGSAEDLADKIRWALQHPIECEAIRKRGQAWVNTQLSDEQVLDSVIRAYRLAGELAGKRRRLRRRCATGTSSRRASTRGARL